MNVSRLENSDPFEQYSFLKHRIRRDEESVESERVRIHFVRNIDGTTAFVGSRSRKRLKVGRKARDPMSRTIKKFFN